LRPSSSSLSLKERLFAEYEESGVENDFYIIMNPQAIAAHPRMIITQSFIFLDFSLDFIVKNTCPGWHPSVSQPKSTAPKQAGRSRKAPPALAHKAGLHVPERTGEIAQNFHHNSM
jgi:hypothetical protein